MKTTITIKGIHCAACKSLIEDVGKDIPGVAACTVDFKTGETVIEYEHMPDWGKFKAEIEQLGDYAVNLWQCGICKLWFNDQEKAQACEAWCKEHASCNLEITQYALK